MHQAGPPPTQGKSMRAFLLLAFPAVLSAQSVTRVIVTPQNPTIVTGETLQLRAQALDANGRPVSGATIRFQQTGGQFEGTVTPEGLVTAGAVGSFPVVVSAVVGTDKPVIAKIEVRNLPGPAATIKVTPEVTKLLAGQVVTLKAKV